MRHILGFVLFFLCVNIVIVQEVRAGCLDDLERITGDSTVKKGLFFKATTANGTGTLQVFEDGSLQNFFNDNSMCRTQKSRAHLVTMFYVFDSDLEITGNRTLAILTEIESKKATRDRLMSTKTWLQVDKVLLLKSDSVFLKKANYKAYRNYHLFKKRRRSRVLDQWHRGYQVKDCSVREKFLFKDNPLGCVSPPNVFGSIFDFGGSAIASEKHVKSFKKAMIFKHRSSQRRLSCLKFRLSLNKYDTTIKIRIRDLSSNLKENWSYNNNKSFKIPLSAAVCPSE